ncbi:UNVERIFIED_ORG: hypothetical protein J2W87_001410 [Pseudomonas putida]|nr:hypothetical protein [Pseudomonas putida]
MKKSLLLATFLVLAACGPSVPKIDGASNAMAYRSLEKIINTMPDGESIQWQTDVVMLKSRYSADEEFSKKFGGKTLEELKPAIAETKTYFIKINRDRHAAIEQKEIDDLQVKLAEFEAQDESNTKYRMIAKTKANIDMYTKSRDQILALNDEQVWDKFGCGCEKTDYKPSGNFSNSNY